jgi:hypothetical protein
VVRSAQARARKLNGRARSIEGRARSANPPVEHARFGGIFLIFAVLSARDPVAGPRESFLDYFVNLEELLHDNWSGMASG